MTQIREPYSVLGVGPTASSLEIRRAYRRRLRCCHPDLAADGGDPDELDALLSAYRIVGDPTRRSIYDTERLKLIAAFMMQPCAHGPFIGGLSGSIDTTHVGPR